METIIMMITLIITNLITNLILYNFFSIKYKKKYGELVTYIFLICTILILAFVNLLHLPILNLITYLGVFIILNYGLFELNNKKDIIVNISFFLVIFLLLDTLCYVFIETIFAKMNSFIEVNLKMITASLMQFVVYNILKSSIMDKNISSLTKKDLVSYICVSVSSLLLMGLCATFASEVISSVRYTFFIIAIGMLLLNVWYIKILESLSQKHELEESLKYMNNNSQMLFEHYHSLEEKEERTRAILHDIKNHLQVLEMVVKDTNGSENKYLNEVKNEITKLTNKVIIDRKILNILFLEKIKEAEENDISIQFNIDCVDTNFIKDFDIITIFSNILDNAIEAVKELEKEERKIIVNIKKVEDLLLICEMNPCRNMLKKNNGKIQTSKKGHTGLGLRNIERILQNYEANMIVEVDENLMFTNTIMIAN